MQYVLVALQYEEAPSHNILIKFWCPLPWMPGVVAPFAPPPLHAADTSQSNSTFKDTWNQSCGAGAQEFFNDGSRSQKLLDGGAEAGAWNLCSRFTALVRGASELCKLYNGFAVFMGKLILEPVPKTLDVWSWNQRKTLKFEFRLHSPAWNYAFSIENPVSLKWS